MKPALLFIAVFILSCALTADAQTSGFTMRLRGMQPRADLFKQDVDDGGVGLNAGYYRVAKDNHFSYDVTVFADKMSYRYYVDDYDYLNGTTLFSGLAATPSYCFNPRGNVHISVGLSLKAGFNWGFGVVHEYAQGDADSDPRVESKSASAGFTSAFAPMVIIGIPSDGGETSAGLELGYDTSDYGTGVNKLRSKYYPPLNYHSGYLFVGVYVRFQ
ncbi:hypothetical protein SAMN05216464_104326 [Mucilaginibacter pineti]|uniref:Outer membrane protein beta-barrel domain-containing protein n=1 Tax=Mucilaginibacter pineti TaxID=1391627 RepID=A0A1G7AZK6_9SPHI|nr:hypothetical protein [Mucilaginibacter pineti]SDE20259.1 hypothetical protein SAMN05216464_104326 [Mucilaginibacter pineti]